MSNPWQEMSLLQRIWITLKALASALVSSPSITPSSFDEDDSIMDYSDSPSRGMWDPTSIYYSSMHDHDETLIHSSFDD